MTYAAPLKVTIRLTVYSQRPRDREQERPRHQGAGSLLRRNSADDGQRHVHHQRHRARHCLAVAPFAGRVLRARTGAGLFPRQDHSLSRKLGGVRVRQQEPAVCPYRPQAQILRLGVSARSRPEDRRADSARVLPRQQDQHQGQEAVLERRRRPDRPEALARHHRQGRRDRRGQGKKITPSLYQGNPEGQDRAGGNRGQRSGRRVCRRRRGRYDHRRSA